MFSAPSIRSDLSRLELIWGFWILFRVIILFFRTILRYLNFKIEFGPRLEHIFQLNLIRRNVLNYKYCILDSRYHIWIRLIFFTVYHKVPSSRLSWLVVHLRIFRLFIDAYVLWFTACIFTALLQNLRNCVREGMVCQSPSS